MTLPMTMFTRGGSSKQLPTPVHPARLHHYTRSPAPHIQCRHKHYLVYILHQTSVVVIPVERSFKEQFRWQLARHEYTITVLSDTTCCTPVVHRIISVHQTNTSTPDKQFISVLVEQYSCQCPHNLGMMPPAPHTVLSRTQLYHSWLFPTLPQCTLYEMLFTILHSAVGQVEATSKLLCQASSRKPRFQVVYASCPFLEALSSLQLFIFC